MFIKANFIEIEGGCQEGKRNECSISSLMIYRPKKNKFKIHFIVKRWNTRRDEVENSIPFKWRKLGSFYFIFFYSSAIDRGSKAFSYFYLDGALRPFSPHQCLFDGDGNNQTLEISYQMTLLVAQSNMYQIKTKHSRFMTAVVREHPWGKKQ